MHLMCFQWMFLIFSLKAPERERERKGNIILIFYSFCLWFSTGIGWARRWWVVPRSTDQLWIGERARGRIRQPFLPGALQGCHMLSEQMHLFFMTCMCRPDSNTMMSSGRIMKSHQALQHISVRVLEREGETSTPRIKTLSLLFFFCNSDINCIMNTSKL